MTTKICGCTPETCGCSEGIQILTPRPTANRPGLSALNYRVGTHGAFLETMKARLTTMTVDVLAADGQSIETFTPLPDLTTRDSSDFSIALLDGWATVADVLTFYQERIANEGFLRTATERRSILELARLTGYALRPGVAASVFLAYTLDEDRSAMPPKPTRTTIPKGSRAQSVPGPGELPQSFETSEPLEARAEWNNLQVRRTRPQNITLANALWVEKIFFAGTDTKLKVGDQLLLVFDSPDTRFVARTVVKAEGKFTEKRTEVQLQPLPSLVLAGLPLLTDFIAKLKSWSVNASDFDQAQNACAVAEQILANIYLGAPMSPSHWAERIHREITSTEDPIVDVFNEFQQNLGEIFVPFPSPYGVTSTAKFVLDLLRPPMAQAAGSLQLARNLGAAFRPGTDSTPQLLVNFVPQLRTTFYTAWTNASVSTATPALKGVFALRVEASLFGANAPKMPTYDDNNKPEQPKDWDEWQLDPSESNDAMFLDQAYDAIQPSSYAVIQQPSTSNIARSVKQVSAAQAVQRTAYGVSGKTTRLAFTDNWKSKGGDLSVLRPVLVRAQSEPLTLVEEPLASDVQGKEISLQNLYNDLTSGRWVIVSGERTDIPGVTGVKASELLMISSLRQDLDRALPGDKTHTTLLLATPTAYFYKRDTVKIYGNVVKATHGETRNEVLGNGDGSQSLQSFALKQPPLTFVSAPTPQGADSTLQVSVNDVKWHEADTLAGLGSKDRKFITKTDDAGKTTVIFGNGEHGARLPTGIANVKAKYRNGIGKPGNVKAEQISLLQSRPLNAKSVINPLPASGGANSESQDQARENAPLAVMSLDRLVSVQDYADFTRTFAGIGKATARKLSDSKRQLVHVTIAGVDDEPIDETSDLYHNVLAALRRFGDPDLPLIVQMRELVTLLLSAKVRLAPDYQWEKVVTQIRATLLDAFGFQKRALGQPVLLSEIISAIQRIVGVEYVDVDAFGGIPEMKTGTDGSRRLLTLDEMSIAAMEIAVPASSVWFFAVEDFVDPEYLVKSLTPKDWSGWYLSAPGFHPDVPKFIWNQFSSEDQKLLKESQAKTPMPATAVATLITEFNRILLGPLIYDASRFENVRISSEIQNMIYQNPQGSALVHLNRLLLEAAYPGKIKPSETKAAPSLGVPQFVPVNLADFEIESGTLHPAQLAIFTGAVPDTLILNQTK